MKRTKFIFSDNKNYNLFLTSLIGSLLLTGCPKGTALKLQGSSGDQPSYRENQPHLKGNTSGNNDGPSRGPKKLFGKKGKILVVYFHGYKEPKASARLSIKDIEAELQGAGLVTEQKFEDWAPWDSKFATDNKSKCVWFDMSIPQGFGKDLWEIVKNAEVFQAYLKAPHVNINASNEDVKEAIESIGPETGEMTAMMSVISHIWPLLNFEQKEHIANLMGKVLGPRLQKAVQEFNTELDKQLQERGIPPGNVVFAGFSQGAMMALAAGVQRESLAIFANKGMLVPGIKPTHWPHFVQIIVGASDPIFKFGVVEELSKLQLQSGLGENLVIESVEEGHEVGLETQNKYKNIAAEIAKKHHEHHGSL